jgi:RES domain
LSERRAREPDLLDELDALPRTEYIGRLWRVVREGREPLQSSHIAGRWDMGVDDALYTSLHPDGAVAENDFRLRQEPVFPSRFKAVLYELTVKLQNVARFDTVDDLRPFGVDPDRYHTKLYHRTQEIGDAAQFLAFTALVAPNARRPCLNLVIYDIKAHTIQVTKERAIDWDAWRAETRVGRRSKA